MKIIELPITANPFDRKEALNEGEILEKYSHPNIVEFVEKFIREDGLHLHVCIVMEYVDGYNLKELV